MIKNGGNLLVHPNWKIATTLFVPFSNIELSDSLNIILFPINFSYEFLSQHNSQQELIWKYKFVWVWSDWYFSRIFETRNATLLFITWANNLNLNSTSKLSARRTSNFSFWAAIHCNYRNRFHNAFNKLVFCCFTFGRG